MKTPTPLDHVVNRAVRYQKLARLSAPCVILENEKRNLVLWFQKFLTHHDRSMAAKETWKKRRKDMAALRLAEAKHQDMQRHRRIALGLDPENCFATI